MNVVSATGASSGAPSFQKLRIEKLSPLKEVVENTPGYHYDRVGGIARFLKEREANHLSE